MPTAAGPRRAAASLPLLSPIVSSPSSASSRPAICSALSPSTTAMLNTQPITTSPSTLLPHRTDPSGLPGSGSRVADGCGSFGSRHDRGAHPAKEAKRRLRLLAGSGEPLGQATAGQGGGRGLVGGGLTEWL